jgi:uncharacterized protein YfdQ (DUF2303 family)
METVNLEKWLEVPERPRGAATLYDPSDFVAYVRRLGNGSTTVWGDEKNAAFTAVLNDHVADNEPGWRDHTARLQLQDDPDWSAFLTRHGKYMGQVQFAEFLQDYQPVFVEPDGATLLEIATDFKAHRKAEFSSEVDLDNGDVSFTYNEVTAQKTNRAGQIELPREFTVALSPFLGMDPVPVLARLRWNIDGGQLQIGFWLQRPDLAKRQAFADIRASLIDGLQETKNSSAPVDVLLGTPPAPVVPQS